MQGKRSLGIRQNPLLATRWVIFYCVWQGLSWAHGEGSQLWKIVGFRRQLLHGRAPVPSSHEVFLFSSRFQQNRVSTAHMVSYRLKRATWNVCRWEHAHKPPGQLLSATYSFSPQMYSRDPFALFLEEFFPPNSVSRRPGFAGVKAALHARTSSLLSILKWKRTLFCLWILTSFSSINSSPLPGHLLFVYFA